MKDRNLNSIDHWATPKELYKDLDKEFNFDFDPCPYQHDLTAWNGLKISWGQRNFVNPPYSRKLKNAFVGKAIQELKNGKLSVLLLPVSTSTKLFHDYIQPFASEIRFIRGRLSFLGMNTKGQLVNYPKEQRTNEGIKHKNKIIPLYIEAKGMHDSMVVVLNPAIPTE